jgi:hypothetical protein
MNQNEEAMKSIRSLRGLDPFTVVFSGDSIAYNRYDFDPVPRTNGYDCFPGMLSWSFLLRDMFVNSSKGYVHGDILAAKHIVNRGEGSVRCGYKRSYVFPQYGRVLWYTAKSAKDKLTVGYNPASAEKIVLYMLSNPLKTSCFFVYGSFLRGHDIFSRYRPVRIIKIYFGFFNEFLFLEYGYCMVVLSF